jgi:hypothetical protein
MADPLSILGAVETSLNFTVLIYNQVKSFINFKHDALDLAIRFKDDKQLLAVFLAFFQDNKHHLDKEQREYFVDSTGHLNETLGSTASDLQKHRPDATFRRVSWGWVKSSLEETEKALRDWVSRLQSRFNMGHRPATCQRATPVSRVGVWMWTARMKTFELRMF